MRSLRGQLILSHILPFLIVLPLITLVLLYLIETQMLLASLSQRSTEQANLLAQAIQRQIEILGNPEQAQSFVADLTVSVDGRVILLGREGQPLATGGLEADGSQQSLPPVGIASALKGQTSVLVTYGLANLVHELGRPLGAIRSAVHVLRGPTGDDPAIREELLGGVEAQIERMQPLLDDLAQLHGQVSGRVELARRPVVLSDWLPSVLLPWRAAALDKGLTWQADVPNGLPVMSVDPDKLAQAIGNLLSNAIKYTPVGGSVAVSAGMQEQDVWICVADTGPGIAAEEQQRVFEPFYRSEHDRRFPQGLGLGLTIAHELVLAHGGRLELDSQPGQGSRFAIHLPLSSSQANS